MTKRPGPQCEYSLLIHVHNLHVHRVDGGEDVRRALHNAFAGLGHRNRSTRGQENRLVAATQRQVGQIVALHQDDLYKCLCVQVMLILFSISIYSISDTTPRAPCKTYLLIAEPHLTPRVPTDVHAAQEHAPFALQTCRRGAVVRRMHAALLRRHTASQFRLYGAVILFIDDVVHAVTVYEQVLHRVAEILGGVVGYVEQFSVLCEHHQEAGESLRTEKGNVRV